MAEITVTRALNELSLLDKKINDATNNASFVAVIIGEKAPPGFSSSDEYEAKVKSSSQKISDLISRRKAIKGALVVSNANTKVQIGTITMSVAEAIERKSSIEYEQRLLQVYKNQYNAALARFNKETEAAQIRLDASLKPYLESAAQRTPADIQKVKDTLMEGNEPSLLDPLNLKQKIEDMESDLGDFLSNVDASLTEINAITKITVPDN